MASAQSSASADAARTMGSMAQQAYGIAMPALQQQEGLLAQGIAQGGEPDYLKSAFAGQRTGLLEGLATQEHSATRAGSRGSQGNLGSFLSPQDIGAQIANAMYSSRTNEALGRIGQVQNLQRMAMGQAGKVGSGAINAGGLQLQEIGMLPQYNPNYAMGLSLANLGGIGYGGYNK